MYMSDYDFGELEFENGLPVAVTSKYKKAKAAAINILKSKKFPLVQEDFWICKQPSADGTTMLYVSLIISHAGCEKINNYLGKNGLDMDAFEVLPKDQTYDDMLVIRYKDKDVIAYGEYSPKNSPSQYPYTTAMNRAFDRALLKKIQFSESNIYSEVEAEEFEDKKEVVVPMPAKKPKKKKENTSMEKLKKSTVSNKELNRYNRNRAKLSDLGIDFYSEEFEQKVLKMSFLDTQDIGKIFSDDDLNALNNAYDKLILEKMEEDDKASKKK